MRSDENLFDIQYFSEVNLMIAYQNQINDHKDGRTHLVDYQASVQWVPVPVQAAVAAVIYGIVCR